MTANKSSLWLPATVCLSAALLAGCHHRRQAATTQTIVATTADQAGEASADQDANGIDLAVKQERNEQFTLQPGARVYLQEINGKVDITTSETDKAEVHLVRSARKNEDFEERQVTIERNDAGDLIIQVHSNRRRSLWAMLGSEHDERQRLELKLPRKIRLEANSINGNATIGELDGSLTVSGMNGDLTAARVTTAVELRGINGNSRITLANLTKQLHTRGINGNLDFTFTEPVNADVALRGVNGQITNELPNTLVHQQKSDRLEARIGTGGVSIEAYGINGNVSFLSAIKLPPANSKLAQQQ